MHDHEFMSPGTVFMLRSNEPLSISPRYARPLSLTQIGDILSNTAIHAEIFYPRIVSHQRYITTYFRYLPVQIWGVTAPAGIPPMTGKQRRRNQSPNISIQANLVLISQPICMSDMFLENYPKTHFIFILHLLIQSNDWDCSNKQLKLCNKHISLKRFWNCAPNELIHAS